MSNAWNNRNSSWNDWNGPMGVVAVVMMVIAGSYVGYAVGLALVVFKVF